jgi:hypothetical protein
MSTLITQLRVAHTSLAARQALPFRQWSRTISPSLPAADSAKLHPLPHAPKNSSIPRIQMRRRSMASWELILANADRFEIEHLEPKSVQALDVVLRRYSTEHEDVFFCLDYDEAAAFATVVKSSTPFPNPATGKPCRVRRGAVSDLRTLDTDAIAGQMAELSEAFITGATTTLLADCLGQAFTAHVLKHRRELRHFGLDAQAVGVIAEQLYATTKRSIAKRLVKKLAAKNGVSAFREVEVAA